jgi:hypothetical protein
MNNTPAQKRTGYCQASIRRSVIRQANFKTLGKKVLDTSLEIKFFVPKGYKCDYPQGCIPLFLSQLRRTNRRGTAQRFAEKELESGCLLPS